MTDTCPECDGFEMVGCEECGGACTIFVGAGEPNEDCEACSGAGEVPCSKCNGAGVIS